MRLDVVLVGFLIDCVFVRIITELKTCRIYDAVLGTIKVAPYNLSRASNFIV
jgi:hypothetical protein